MTIQVDNSNIESNSDDFNLEIVVCLQPDLTYFCSLIKLAKSDPKVAQLYDPLTVATVFAPTDRVSWHRQSGTVPAWIDHFPGQAVEVTVLLGSK